VHDILWPNVFALDFEANKPVEFAPMMYMMCCTTSATNRTRDANKSPSAGFICQLFRELKVMRQAKEMLRAMTE
jgi:hypothetical protein